MRSFVQYFDRYFSALGIKKYLPGIAWFFIICVLISLPGKDLPPGNPFFEWIMFDKWVHAGLFGVMAFTIIRPLSLKFKADHSSKTLWLIGICVSLFGFLTEVAQHTLVNGREFDIWDWAADTAGVIIAFYINKRTLPES